jgi:uncharacterized small protein (TIGR04563 family)
MSDKRKQSIYLPDDVLLDLRSEANRTDRSLSWLIQQAWKMARANIADLPTIPKHEDVAHQPAIASASF